MTREEAIADFKKEVENGKVIVRAYKNNGLTVKNVERTIERDEMAIKALSVPEGEYINKSVVLTEMDKRHAEGDFITKGFINSLPTISVPERKKGEWIRMGEAYVCSRCSTTCACTETADKWIWHTEDKFCRGCGADMRGE